jgi:hypothetical protein
MTIQLKARPVSRRYQDAMHPAYDIYQGSMQIPEYSLVAVAAGWDVVPVAGRYGVMFDQEQIAREINARVKPTMTFREVLAQIRNRLEAWEAELAAEAAAERETERRAEAFWENRMTDADYEQEREEWARDPWLAALEEGRR